MKIGKEGESKRKSKKWIKKKKYLVEGNQNNKINHEKESCFIFSWEMVNNILMVTRKEGNE